MATLTVLIILLSVTSLFAQAPYTGGSGDGYAVTELVLRNVGINEIASNPFQVYPTIIKVGEVITVSAKSSEPYTIRIIDITGKVLLKAMQQSGNSTIAYTIPGVSFVVLESLSGRVVQKIIVME